MLTVFIGWVFVVVVFALAQATAPDGTLLGALVTCVVGLAPLAVVLYIVLAASRRRVRRASAAKPDRGGHPSGDPVAAKGEEP